MKPIILQATEDTPEVILNPSENIFRIARISVPEDAYEFYQPLIQWLNEYSKNPLPETIFEFDMDYVNTASNKQLMQLMLVLNKIAQNYPVTVKWFYESIDEDMLSLGKRFQKLAKNVNFEFFEI